MKLRELAHSRTGDKGNTLNISVICYDAKHYEHLRTVLTPERVKAHLRDVVQGDVVRHELPAIAAFNFVLGNALGVHEPDPVERMHENPREKAQQKLGHERINISSHHDIQQRRREKQPGNANARRRQADRHQRRHDHEN